MSEREDSRRETLRAGGAAGGWPRSPRRQSGSWLSGVPQDARDACRALMSSRGYAMWVIGSLAIGMAVTIAALALLNAELVQPFPGVTGQHRLVRISVSRDCGRPDCWRRMSSSADELALRDGLTGLQALASYTQGEVAVALPAARSMRALVTSADYFEVLGVRPARGRLFDPADARTHAAVAVLSHSAWTREFDADPHVAGRSIRVADQFVQIVGVAPPFFIGIDRVRPGGRAPDVWLPIWLADRVLPLLAGEQGRQERAAAFVGRLKDGVGVPRIKAETEVVAQRLAASGPQPAHTAKAEVDRVWRVRPESWHFGVIVVMPIPVLILVIACVNAASLMVAHGSQRQREMAIRVAIGAGRGRIIRQLLIESALLAVVATAAAVPLASWGLQLASSPLNTPIPIDPTVLVLTVLTAAVTTAAFGLAPAVRLSAQRPWSTLGSAGARNDALPRQSRMRRVLIVAQAALSLGLLASGSQLVSTVRAQAVSGGTPADRLLIARFDLRALNVAERDAGTFYRDLVAGASRLPGVEAVGVARHDSIWTFGQRATRGSLVVWRPADRPDESHAIAGGYAGGDLFEAVGLRVVAGRSFTDADRQARPQVAVLNETAATMLDGPVVGSTLRVATRGQDFGSSIDVRIVGVIEPAREPRLELADTPGARVYLPSPLEPEPALSLYLRTRGTATALAQPVRELVGRIAPRVPVNEIGSLDELNERSYAIQLWLARSAAFLGVIGLLLATAGVYGVSSYVVAMRTREMAIRIAVGATRRVILAMVLGQSMRVAVIGLMVGAVAAAVVSRLIQSEYHGITGIDGPAFAAAVALFLAAMLLASAIPAVRASRVDPVESLRDA